MAKKLTSEEKLPELTKQLLESLSRWRYLYDNGGSDPFWSDGVNLNLVRNHIIYFKNQIFELCEENLFFIPEEYDLPTPESVPNDYMARASDIIKTAQQAYILYENDAFSKLSNILSKIPPKSKQAAINIIGYKHGCQQAVKENDLVKMRRYSLGRVKKDIEAAEKYLKELNETAEGADPKFTERSK